MSYQTALSAEDLNRMMRWSLDLNFVLDMMMSPVLLKSLKYGLFGSALAETIDR